MPATGLGLSAFGLATLVGPDAGCT
jgi:hypothetical protein